MSHNRALDAALALARTPTLASVMRRQLLPPGISLLLEIVSGDLQAVERAAQACRLDQYSVTLAAELYVQQVMLFPGASPHRVLGVQVSADHAEMRRHLRWLMTWLHPDKNASGWHSAFATRVLAAWREVSTQQARPGPRLTAVVPATGCPTPIQTRNPMQVTRRPHVARPVRLPWVAQPLPARAPSSLRMFSRRFARIGGACLLLLILATPSDKIELLFDIVASEIADEPLPDRGFQDIQRLGDGAATSAAAYR